MRQPRFGGVCHFRANGFTVGRSVPGPLAEPAVLVEIEAVAAI